MWDIYFLPRAQPHRSASVAGDDSDSSDRTCDVYFLGLVPSGRAATGQEPTMPTSPSFHAMIIFELRLFSMHVRSSDKQAEACLVAKLLGRKGEFVSGFEGGVQSCVPPSC